MTSVNRPSSSVSTTGDPTSPAGAVTRTLAIGSPVSSATTRPRMVSVADCAWTSDPITTTIAPIVTMRCIVPQLLICRV
jgi:hypothetical protein